MIYFIYLISCIFTGWQQFGENEYLFVLDSGRLLDKTRPLAKLDCLEKGGDLVSFESEEQLDFVKDQIRAKLADLGQSIKVMSNEQWWTNGISYKQLRWIWDTNEQPDSKLYNLKLYNLVGVEGYYSFEKK